MSIYDIKNIGNIHIASDVPRVILVTGDRKNVNFSYTGVRPVSISWCKEDGSGKDVITVLHAKRPIIVFINCGPWIPRGSGSFL